MRGRDWAGSVLCACLIALAALLGKPLAVGLLGAGAVLSGGYVAVDVRRSRRLSFRGPDLTVAPAGLEMVRLQIQGIAGLNVEMELFRVPLRITNGSTDNPVSLTFDLRVRSSLGITATLSTDTIAQVVSYYQPQVTWWNLPDWASASPQAPLNIGCQETAQAEACFAWQHDEAAEGTYDPTAPVLLAITDLIIGERIEFRIPGGYPTAAASAPGR
jgi:hypothetical protein